MMKNGEDGFVKFRLKNNDRISMNTCIYKNTNKTSGRVSSVISLAIDGHMFLPTTCRKQKLPTDNSVGISSSTFCEILPTIFQLN